MSQPTSPDRGPLETLTLAGFGALALAAQRADELADRLADRFGVDQGEMRDALADAVDSWRREAKRIGSTAGETASQIGGELGLASREIVDELELRVAQIEHRLKLLERGS